MEEIINTSSQVYGIWKFCLALITIFITLIYWVDFSIKILLAGTT